MLQMRLILFLIVCVSAVISIGISTMSQTFNVKETSMLKLPCQLQGASDNSVIWKRGEDVLFMDEDKLTEDTRFDIDKESENYTLIIDGVEPIDAADYTCEMIVDQDTVYKIVHKVVVVVPPQLHISPDTSPLMVTKGDHVVLRCSAYGNPLPKVKWSKKSGKIPASIEVKSNQLRFNASAEHSGEYICTGTNSASSTIKSIELQVADKPWTKTERSYISVGLGDSVNVSCQYDGNPPPQVEWLFNGRKINMADKIFESIQQLGKREQNYSVTCLMVKDLSEGLFGDYMCRITNNLGSDHQVVHVSGRPGPPVLSVDGTQLTWSVLSKEPVLEYAIHYRLSNEDTFTHREYIRADKRDRTGANEYTNSINLQTYLKEGEKYHLQVEARNSVGWGSMARTYSTIEMPIGKPVTSEVASSSTVNIVTTLAVAVLSQFL